MYPRSRKTPIRLSLASRLAEAAVAAFAVGVLFACGGGGDHVSSRVVAVTNPNALPGAIFTTLEDGARVNHNLYEHKQDVYLDGGPGDRAPASAAGLPEGDYYFQVTDPSGKVLLSTDHISCRRVHVNGAGVVDLVYAGTTFVRERGSWGSATCRHASGIDQDHTGDGAITVQLYPFDNTPNKGGVYKVWMTRTEHYVGDPAFEPTHANDAINGEGWAPQDFHGFVPSRSKKSVALL